jgi:hypothetical protein
MQHACFNRSQALVVAIQVDACGIHASSCDPPIRIHVGDRCQLNAGRRRCGAHRSEEPAYRRAGQRFVAMLPTNQQDTRAGLCGTNAVDVDRATLRGRTEKLPEDDRNG